jgi:acetyl-CoA C-acetyltransferase
MRAEPLRDAHFSRPVDGAVAVILAQEEVIDTRHEPVWITGMGAAMDRHSVALRELHSYSACRAAASSAYAMAGIERPSAMASLVETSAGTAVSQLMVLESLGFADPGKGIELYRTARHHPVVNPSGGSLPADPVMATGLIRLAEARRELVDGPNGSSVAVVHASGGVGQQTHCVLTLEASA